MRSSRPSLFVAVTVRHPRLPFGRLWVPLLSVGVYVAAWCMRVVLGFVPKRKLRERMGGKTPVDPATLGPLLTKLTWVVLCSGSYTLVDVVVEEGGEEVGVRIRLI